MQLETLLYRMTTGWLTPLDAGLDSPSTLVLIFAAPGFMDAPEAIEEVVRAFPQSHIVGCSTAGEIFGASLEDDSLSIAVVRFEATELATTVAPIGSADESFAAGSLLAERLLRPSLRGVFVLSDGLNVNGSALIRGLNSVLPDTVVVTGGLAGDGDRLKRTWVLNDGRPQSGFISAVGFYGDRVRIGHGSRGGWDIFGPERMVTRSRDNVLFELDGKPALQLYKAYLGDLASGLPANAMLFPLSLRSSTKEKKSVVRTILSIDERNQSMTFAGDIPEGSLAQLMCANYEHLIDGASIAASGIRCDDSSSPQLCIAISCVGRRLVLGERTEEELEAALEMLGPGSQQIGFYSYGEICPHGVGHCDLHNQTMTITTLREG